MTWKCVLRNGARAAKSSICFHEDEMGKKSSIHCSKRVRECKKLRRIEKEEKKQMRFIIKYSSFGENSQSSRYFFPSHSLHGYSLDGCWQNKFLFALLCMHKTYDI